MPDGNQVSFPDDMPKEQIQGLIAKKFPQDVASHYIEVGQALQSGMSWGQVAKSAVTNAPSSAFQFGKAMVEPFAHPVDTAENLGAIGKGVMQKLGLASGQDSEKYADAVGKFLKDRYGSVDAIKKTLATDPVGVAADVSMILTGGGSAAARAPGIIGKVGEVAATAGRAVDPLSAVGAAAKVGGRVASEVGGIYTGSGSSAIQMAAKAGQEGGEAGKAFRENLTGSANVVDVVDEARKAATQLRLDRGNVYRANMAKVGSDKTVLDFTGIDQAIQRVSGVKTFKGQVISAKTQGVRQEITDAVEGWKNLEPAEYHTADGLDALKQKIGSIRDSTQYGTPDRLIADAAYKSVYKTIADQVPEYAKAMKGYEEASSIIREVDGELSLKPNANVSTSLRKLQSVLRNNVSTNFGRRAELVELLQKSGAKNLMEKLAGQALSDWAPRGLSRLIVGGEGAAILANPEHATHLLLGIIGSSPKLWGGASYATGAATRLPLRQLGQSAFQAGRLPQ